MVVVVSFTSQVSCLCLCHHTWLVVCLKSEQCRFFFFCGIGIWMEDLCFLTWLSTPQVIQILFALVILHVYAQASLDCVWDDRHCHWAQILLVEMESLIFCLGWPWTSILPISPSQVVGITGMNYDTWLKSEQCSFKNVPPTNITTSISPYTPFF
jgi:hypothetical protein